MSAYTESPSYVPEEEVDALMKNASERTYIATHVLSALLSNRDIDVLWSTPTERMRRYASIASHMADLLIHEMENS